MSNSTVFVIVVVVVALWRLGMAWIEKDQKPFSADRVERGEGEDQS